MMKNKKINMTIKTLILTLTFLLSSTVLFAACKGGNFFSDVSTDVSSELGINTCEPQNYKILYCDVSGGRSVLNNGDYSKKYCRWTAIMDFQGINNCCTWRNGVMLVSAGKVICGDGSVSPICSTHDALQGMHKRPFYEKSDDSVDIPESEYLE